MLVPPSIIVLAFFVSWRRISSAQESNNQNNGRLSDDLDLIIKSVIPANYNWQRPPDFGTEKSINVSFVFFSLSQVVFSKMEFEVEFLFRAAWTDERFNTTIFETNADAEKLPLFEVPEKAVEHIWVPTMIYPDCKHCGTGLATSRKKTLMYNWRDNTLVTFYRDTMTFSCVFDLSFYPFDMHQCSVNIFLMEPLSTIKLKLTNFKSFNGSPDKFVTNGMPPEFQLGELTVGSACSERCSAHNSTPNSCLQYGISFSRIPHFHMMLVYSPTVTIILISWISFWLPVDATAPRVSLGMTSLLTLSTQFANAQQNLPPVAYLKALDVWMLMCTVMVFGSLLEFTLAHIFRNPKKIQVPVIKVKQEEKGLPMSPAGDGRIMRVAYVPTTPKKPEPPKTIPAGVKEVNWLDAKENVDSTTL